LHKRVVITGIGIISSIGINAEDFWENALKGRSAVEKIPQQWKNYNSFTSDIWSPLPEIDYGLFELSRIEQKQLDKSSLNILSAAYQAVNGAGLKLSMDNPKNNTFRIMDIDCEGTGVFIGTGNGGISTIGESLSFQILNNIKTELTKKVLKDPDIYKTTEKMLFPKRFNPFSVSMIMPNAVSANVSIKFGIKGQSDTISSACASGTIAVGKGFKAIRNNELKTAIAGGTEYLYDDYGTLFYSFDILKTLASGYESIEKANRPFDKNRSGFLFSQGGAGVLILEELESALKRNAPVIAEITGYAENCDAHNIIVMDPDKKMIKNMINKALSSASAKADEIDYINAHGTGTKLNDEAESEILLEIFGNKSLVNSTKSLLGHTLGASGAIEAAVTALSIKNKTTHISKNLEDPVNELNFVRSSGNYDIKKAMTHSFGFGGHNAGLVLEEFR
jgi:3-oxoacyl-[acyl-carrier-protein] synthase II